MDSGAGIGYIYIQPSQSNLKWSLEEETYCRAIEHIFPCATCNKSSTWSCRSHSEHTKHKTFQLSVLPRIGTVQRPFHQSHKFQWRQREFTAKKVSFLIGPALQGVSLAKTLVSLIPTCLLKDAPPAIRGTQGSAPGFRGSCKVVEQQVDEILKKNSANNKCFFTLK